MTELLLRRISPLAILFLILVAGQIQSVALASPSVCRHLFSGASTQLSRLQHPEVEAKFVTRDAQVFLKLKKLDGQTITLTHSNGKAAQFLLKMNKEHLYEDEYFDTKDNALINRSGLLRRRIRFDRLPEATEFNFAKAVFQAKDHPARMPELDDAVLARNEIRGKSKKNKKKVEKYRRLKPSDRTKDTAVVFARHYSQSNKPFISVLKIFQKRFFLKVTPLDEKQPSFYLSLDEVHYSDSRNPGKVVVRYELEAELIENLSLEAPQVQQRMIGWMNQLSQYLLQNYDVHITSESKYQTGRRLFDY